MVTNLLFVLFLVASSSFAVEKRAESTGYLIKLLQRAAPTKGERCSRFDKPCQGDLECTFNICQCPDSRPFWNGTSCRVAKYGEECQRGGTCEGNLECVNGKCGCSYLMKWNGTTCEPPTIGESCSAFNKPACKSNLECSLSLCQCPYDRPIWNRTSCRGATKGEKCDGPFGCEKGLTCKNSKCDCSGFMKWDGSACKAPKKGEKCYRLDSPPCESNLECSLDDTCECPTSKPKWTGTSCRAPTIGESCTTFMTSCASNLVCSLGRCKCLTSDSKWDGSSCKTKSCKSDSDCPNGGECVFSKCIGGDINNLTKDAVTYFWILYVVLGILIPAIIIGIVFYYYRKRQNRRRLMYSQQMQAAQGQSNPGY